MTEEKRNKILPKKNQLFENAQKVGSKDGTPIEKGVLLNENFLNKNFEKLGDACSIFTAYPDVFLDLITPEDSNIRLFFYQRIFLRAAMRFQRVNVSACRAFSKSFLTILGLFLQCIFIPGRKVFICAPNKTQGAQIGKEKLTEIFRMWPLLRKEVIGGDIVDTPGNYGKDYITLKFRNGSVFDLVGALESTLGGRRHGGLIDEAKNHDETMINTVVLPLLNVSRRMPDNTVNPREINQQTIFATSAWQKTSFSYDRLIDDFETAIINPKQSFCFGCDYRVPVLHGLLDKNFINDLKMSPSFNETSFATEYLSIWQGASAEAWFNFDKMTKYRKVKNPENHAICRANANQFYLLSVDVGRLHDQTVCSVFRVNITNDGKHYATLVNLYVLGREAQTKTFYQQAIDLKKIIKNFNPLEVVIDTNGLGIGFGEEMTRQQVDECGEIWPSYGFKNDEDFQKTQPKDAPQILFGIKANAQLNSKIHGNAYTRLNSGMVRFLIKEQEAKSSLLATKIGQKMSTIQRIERLMPHEMTTKLFEEMANLRLKKTGNATDIVLERINERHPKDKYSSFSYGLWRIKELEEEYFKKRRRFSTTKRQLVFCSGGV